MLHKAWSSAGHFPKIISLYPAPAGTFPNNPFYHNKVFMVFCQFLLSAVLIPQLTEDVISLFCSSDWTSLYRPFRLQWF
jgi:hypothetical protein